MVWNAETVRVLQQPSVSSSPNEAMQTPLSVLFESPTLTDMHRLGMFPASVIPTSLQSLIGESTDLSGDPSRAIRLASRNLRHFVCFVADMSTIRTLTGFNIERMLAGRINTFNTRTNLGNGCTVKWTSNDGSKVEILFDDLQLGVGWGGSRFKLAPYQLGPIVGDIDTVSSIAVNLARQVGSIELVGELPDDQSLVGTEFPLRVRVLSEDSAPISYAPVVAEVVSSKQDSNARLSQTQFRTDGKGIGVLVTQLSSGKDGKYGFRFKCGTFTSKTTTKVRTLVAGHVRLHVGRRRGLGEAACYVSGVYFLWRWNQRAFVAGPIRQSGRENSVCVDPMQRRWMHQEPPELSCQRQASSV